MNLTGEERFRQTPDALRQRRSKSEGNIAAATDAQSANSSPTPQFNTAGENYQGKIGNSDHNNLQPPVDGSSPPNPTKKPTTSEEGLGFGTRAPDGPQPHLPATSPIEEDRAASRGAGAREIQQQHRSVGRLSGLQLRTTRTARQAADLRK